MADIDVERKGGMGWLWWLLGLIVLALVVWAIVEAMDTDEPEVGVTEPVPAVAPGVTPEPGVPGAAAMPAAVTTYLSQCTEQLGAPEGDMGLQHQFTVNCLQQLREGMNSLITQEQVANTDVSQQFDQYTGTVQQLQASDPSALTHANLTQDAASTAVEVMQAMQTAWFAGNQQVQTAVSEVRQAVQGIQQNVPMLEQRDSVQAFFREAGEALRMMAENRTVAAPA